MLIKEYSEDLRSRVIKHIESGSTQITASRLFKVSRSTVSRWWIAYVEDGRTSAKSRGGSKGKINQEDLRIFVTDNNHKTLLEIGQHFGVSAWAINKRLKRLRFSYKKKPSPTWKQVKKNELRTKD
jgi:transposase